jgi:hypothetical protein
MYKKGLTQFHFFSQPHQLHIEFGWLACLLKLIDGIKHISRIHQCGQHRRFRYQDDHILWPKLRQVRVAINPKKNDCFATRSQLKCFWFALSKISKYEDKVNFISQFHGQCHCHGLLSAMSWWRTHPAKSIGITMSAQMPPGMESNILHSSLTNNHLMLMGSDMIGHGLGKYWPLPAMQQ